MGRPDTAPSSRLRPLLERRLRRMTSVLFWTGVIALGAFGVYFSFANYPAFGIGVTLSIAVLVGYSERSRRKKQRELERARRRGRTRSRIGVS